MQQKLKLEKKKVVLNALKLSRVMKSYLNILKSELVFSYVNSHTVVHTVILLYLIMTESQMDY